MITVLMGAPGAGKSTWLKANLTPGAHIASTQAIRVDREIDRGAFMNNMRLKAIKAAENGKDIFCDGTHTMTQHRLIWLNLANRLNIKSRLIAFNTPLNLLLYAQTVREFPAPKKIVISHYQRFNKALKIINDENWDEIIQINRIDTPSDLRL